VGRLGFWLPSVAPPETLPGFAARAEELGYDSVWASEGRHGDQFAILTACALSTSTISLGTNIASIFTRSIPLLGMAAATVDAFSGGRMVLGLGTDHAEQVVDMHSLTYEKPLARMRDAVTIIRQLFAGSLADYHGEVLSVDHFDMWFRPPQCSPTIYLGGLNPKMLETAGAIADGVITINRCLDWIPRVRERVRQGAELAGKDPDSVVIASVLTCAVDEDREVARQNMRRYVTTPARARMPRYAKVRTEQGFGDEWASMVDAINSGDPDRAAASVTDRYLDAFYVTGTPAECRERMQAFIDAGVDFPILGNAGPYQSAWGLLDALAPQTPTAAGTGPDGQAHR
jgi:alkanesulfonate monooxygenase SsuD/methylene tetrahydromethanopterin reductase-like flavin-dependent oxidoreductase (luciferase family)